MYNRGKVTLYNLPLRAGSLHLWPESCQASSMTEVEDGGQTPLLLATWDATKEAGMDLQLGRGGKSCVALKLLQMMQETCPP